MHDGDGGNPRNRRRWVLPAALVVVGVLMMVIGSFLALFGPLYGAQRMLERGSPSESPGSLL
jgi:hypothetical protein